MIDLASVLQELNRHDIGCRVESRGDRGFRIELGDQKSGEYVCFDIDTSELPAAAERLWMVACQHYRSLTNEHERAAQRPPAEKVVPLSRLVAHAFPADPLPGETIPDPLGDVDVTCYAVLAENEQFETVWYANTRGEVREEMLARREAWRQSERFRHAEEKTAEQFQHLFVE